MHSTTQTTGAPIPRYITAAEWVAKYGKPMSPAPAEEGSR